MRDIVFFLLGYGFLGVKVYFAYKYLFLPSVSSAMRQVYNDGYTDGLKGRALDQTFDLGRTPQHDS